MECYRRGNGTGAHVLHGTSINEFTVLVHFIPTPILLTYNRAMMANKSTSHRSLLSSKLPTTSLERYLYLNWVPSRKVKDDA
jgi:hypothetical protein